MPRECRRTRPDLTLLEALFDSEAMLLMGRLLIVVAAVVLLACGLFVLGSVVVRVRRGHWLRRAGPFEVSDPATSDVSRGVEALEHTVGEQQARIVVLESLLSVWGRRLVDIDDEDEGDS